MPMRIILAGTSGLRKREIAEQFAKTISRQISASGDEANGAVRILYPEQQIHMATFLERQTRAQAVQISGSYNSVFENSSRKALRAAKVILAPLHFSFVHYDRAFTPLSWPPIVDGKTPSILLDFLRRFRPDYIINLVDDIHHVQQRIRSDKGFYELRLRELLKWREFELSIADYCANAIIKRKWPDSNLTTDRFERSPIFPIHHSADVLYRYIFEPHLPRVYVSFPISRVRREVNEKRRSERVAEINHVVEMMSDHFAAFNPLTIDEMPLNFLYRQALERSEVDGSPLSDEIPFPSQLRWSTPGNDKLITDPRVDIPALKMSDLRDVSSVSDQEKRSIIGRQVEARDYRLIDQSDCVVIYRPTSPPDYNWSRGTRMEYNHAIGAAEYRAFTRIFVIKDKDVDGPLGEDAPNKNEESPFLVRSRNLDVIDEFGNLDDPKNRARALTLVIKKIQESSLDLTRRRRVSKADDTRAFS